MWYLHVPFTAVTVDLNTLSSSGSVSRPCVCTLVSPGFMPGIGTPVGMTGSVERWWLRYDRNGVGTGDARKFSPVGLCGIGVGVSMGSSGQPPCTACTGGRGGVNGSALISVKLK